MVGDDVNWLGSHEQNEWRCCFSSCREHNEKKLPFSEEGEGAEWRDLWWYLLCLSSVPFPPRDVG